MKPNGMRAWRKTARRWRRKQNRHWRETGAPCVADGTGRWYRRQQAFFKQRPAAPSRPFTPRSLVGMTQSARKRAARRWLWPWMQRREALRDFREMIAEAPGVKVEYHLSRRRYRIGERLRPCQWCGGPQAFAACKGKRVAQEVVGAHRHGECVFCRTCADAKLTLLVENPDACDGSGVLPANR